MVMIRGNYGDTLAPGFREIFFQKFGERPSQYTDIYNVESSTRQYEDDSFVSGFGTIPLKSEGVEMDSDDVIQGFDKAKRCFNGCFFSGCVCGCFICTHNNSFSYSIN